jgi:hypothetical protein
MALARLKATAAVLNEPPKPEPAKMMPAMAARITGRWVSVEPNELGLEALMLDFGDTDAKVGVIIAGRRYLLPVGLDGVYRFTSQGPSQLPTAVRGYWPGQNTFVLDYDEAGRVNPFSLQMRFTAEQVSIVINESTGLYNNMILEGQCEAYDGVNPEHGR